MSRSTIPFATIAATLLVSAGVAQPPPSASPRTVAPVAAKPIAANDAVQAAEFLEKAYNGTRPPESVRMLHAILLGSQLGPGEGWFGPAQTRYTWEWLAKQCAVDPAKGAIPRDRFRGTDPWFARLDRNKDGHIGPEDLDWSDRNPYIMQSGMVNRWFRRMNAQGNGKLTRDELLNFFEKAAQGKDHMTPDDLRDALLGGASGGGFSPGDAPTPEVLVRGLFAGEIGSLNEGPQVGQPAPNFSLKTVDGKDEIQLTKLLGSKPVVLVFGNFTCGPFRSFYPEVEAVYQRYKADVNFLMVYVREAHPTDGWKMESNAKSGVVVKQPTTYTDRVAVAGQFCTRLKPTMPVAVDEINDPVGNAYSGMPARLYVIDRQGKVAYKSGRGPFGFRVGEMEQALVMALLEQMPPARLGRVPLLSDGEAWAKLPTPDAELVTSRPALPAWAKAMAAAMPKTTAAVLELDALHRTKSPVDPKLWAAIRYVAAHANRNPYGEAYALADLRHAGGSDSDINAIQIDPGRWMPEHRPALTFAQKLTTAANTVTDEEFAGLRKQYSDATVVAMVQLLAFANFQDRLVLSLGVEVEEGGPLPPLAVRFRKPFAGAADVPKRPVSARGDQTALAPQMIDDTAWTKLDFGELQAKMEVQRAREPRIPVPSFESIRKYMPPNYPKDREVKIKWSLVCTGYQPERAAAWSLCTRSFGDESKQDRVFEETLFWVVTRSLECFY